MSLQFPLIALLVLVALRVVIGVAQAHLDRLDRSLIPVPVERRVRALTPRTPHQTTESSDLAA